eukprot:9486260-Pyramimonas_sp.AAC.4
MDSPLMDTTLRYDALFEISKLEISKLEIMKSGVFRPLVSYPLKTADEISHIDICPLVAPSSNTNEAAPLVSTLLEAN